MPFDGLYFDKPSSTTKKLMQARDLIEAGWVKGMYRNGIGEVCILGAIGYDYSKPITVQPRSPRYQALLRLRKVIGRVQLARWNDTPKRTKKEVLAAFDKAIANEILAQSSVSNKLSRGQG